MDKKFKEMMDELKVVRKQLNEAYMFDDEESVNPYEDEGMMNHEGEGMVNHEVEQGESEEEKAMHAQEVVKHEPIIAKIRETAIEGLRKYSDNPTSEIYTFFKKVFLESDKVLVDGSNKK